MTAAPYQAPTPSDPKSWDLAKNAELAHSAVAGEVIADLADSDDRIVLLTADLKFSNRTSDFEARHPSRFVNVGIAEQHMVTMAAGMAACGHIPYVATFASFVGLLCAEHMRTDLAYPNLPVRVLAHHSGISLGYYGTSHHATEDIGITRSMANMTVVSPADARAIRTLIGQTVDLPGPVYFRLGRGREPDVYTDEVLPKFGELTELSSGDDVLVVTTGIGVQPSLQAARSLAGHQIGVKVLDAHTLRPFPAESFVRTASSYRQLVVVEEHNVYGGLASTCADALIDAGASGIKLTRLGMPADEYALIGPPHYLYEHYGLSSSGIEQAIKDVLS